MTTAWREGWRRVLAAPVVIAGVFAVTLLAAAPLAIALRGSIEAHLGRSLMANQAADGVNWAADVISVGALAGLTTVATVVVLGQTRLWFGMSRDGLVRPPPAVPAWMALLIGVVIRRARRPG